MLKTFKYFPSQLKKINLKFSAFKIYRICVVEAAKILRYLDLKGDTNVRQHFIFRGGTKIDEICHATIFKQL
jgi:hypothetical protein